MVEEIRGSEETAPESISPANGSAEEGLCNAGPDRDGPDGISLEELRSWLMLGAVRGLSGHGAVRLVNTFGSPQAVIEACKSGVVPEDIRPKLASAIAGSDNSAWADRELEAASKCGVTILAYADPRYPALLKEIPDPPHLLYVRGRRLELLSLPSVGVVGTRLATGYGRMISESISYDLANLGIVVVSGGARGCDTAAHKGALKAEGATIAVLGTGVDVVYPKENGRLYEEIAEKGLLLSVFSMSTPPAQYNFPRRNRIISGLSLGVLIAEAPVRSGALMTARLALEQNREVFAVPGSVSSEKSKGANKLLKEGAALVESAVDIVEALSISIVGHAVKGHSGSAGPVDGPVNFKPDMLNKVDIDEGPGKGEKRAEVTPSLTAEEGLVLASLGALPTQIDSIIGATGLSVAAVSTLLLGLELRGLVAQKPGKSFVKSF